MILSSRLLSNIPGVIHGFSTRDSNLPEEGNMSRTVGAETSVKRNRAWFADRLGVAGENLVIPRQVHKTDIQILDRNDQTGETVQLPPCDGVVADTPGRGIGILAADCCCLLAANAGGTVIGAFHAGWRGTLGGMAGKAVTVFQDSFSVSASDLVFWIGPAICGRCYEVGEDVWGRFREAATSDSLLTDPYRIDLPILNRNQLIEAGVHKENIEVSEICTYESEVCFSHRRKDRPVGRMLGVIAIG